MSPLKVIGLWIAVETGVGYALVETKNAKAFYELCAAWSDYMQISITPVIPLSELSLIESETPN